MDGQTMERYKTPAASIIFATIWPKWWRQCTMDAMLSLTLCGVSLTISSGTVDSREFLVQQAFSPYTRIHLFFSVFNGFSVRNSVFIMLTLLVRGAREHQKCQQNLCEMWICIVQYRGVETLRRLDKFDIHIENEWIIKYHAFNRLTSFSTFFSYSFFIDFLLLVGCDGNCCTAGEFRCMCMSG